MSWLKVRRDRPWALSECCSGHCGSSLGREWELPGRSTGTPALLPGAWVPHSGAPEWGVPHQVL